jgi:hypothetical protein
MGRRNEMSAPVRHTCPNIDKLIINVNTLLDLAKSNKEDTDFPEEINCYLSDFEYELEKLRDSNSSLREWGEHLEEVLDDLEKTLSNR